MIHYHGVSSKKHHKKYFSAVMQKESVYLFMESNYGKIHAVVYRCVWIFSSFIRATLCYLAYAFTLIFYTKNRKNIYFVLQKYIKIISWGFGFQKWVKKGG
jgi:hypothetical protein